MLECIAWVGPTWWGVHIRRSDNIQTGQKEEISIHKFCSCPQATSIIYQLPSVFSQEPRNVLYTHHKSTNLHEVLLNYSWQKKGGEKRWNVCVWKGVRVPASQLVTVSTLAPIPRWYLTSGENTTVCVYSTWMIPWTPAGHRKCRPCDVSYTVTLKHWMFFLPQIDTSGHLRSATFTVWRVINRNSVCMT